MVGMIMVVCCCFGRFFFFMSVYGCFMCVFGVLSFSLLSLSLSQLLMRFIVWVSNHTHHTHTHTHHNNYMINTYEKMTYAFDMRAGDCFSVPLMLMMIRPHSVLLSLRFYRSCYPTFRCLSTLSPFHVP